MRHLGAASAFARSTRIGILRTFRCQLFLVVGTLSFRLWHGSRASRFVVQTRMLMLRALNTRKVFCFSNLPCSLRVVMQTQSAKSHCSPNQNQCLGNCGTKSTPCICPNRPFSPSMGGGGEVLGHPVHLPCMYTVYGTKGLLSLLTFVHQWEVGVLGHPNFV